jgi:hypothetical protein
MVGPARARDWQQAKGPETSPGCFWQCGVRSTDSAGFETPEQARWWGEDLPCAHIPVARRIFRTEADLPDHVDFYSGMQRCSRCDGEMEVALRRLGQSGGHGDVEQPCFLRLSTGQAFPGGLIGTSVQGAPPNQRQDDTEQYAQGRTVASSLSVTKVGELQRRPEIFLTQHGHDLLQGHRAFCPLRAPAQPESEPVL